MSFWETQISQICILLLSNYLDTFMLFTMIFTVLLSGLRNHKQSLCITQTLVSDVLWLYILCMLLHTLTFSNLPNNELFCFIYSTQVRNDIRVRMTPKQLHHCEVPPHHAGWHQGDLIKKSPSVNFEFPIHSGNR